MSKQQQNVGDNSSSQQAGRDIHNHGSDYSQVQQIARDVMKGELAIARAEAQEEMNRRLEHFADKLVPSLVNKEVSSSKFSRPEVQLFIHDTQKRFLESGQENPNEVTIDLITNSLSEAQGSPRELIYREAAKIAASLNQSTANFLSLLFLVSRTKRTGSVKLNLNIRNGAGIFDLKSGIRPLLVSIENDFSKLFPPPRLSTTDRDYLRMIGVLSPISVGSFHIDDYFKKLADSISRPFESAEIEELRTLGAVDSDFVWLDDNKRTAYIAPKPMISFANIKSDGTLVPATEQVSDEWRRSPKWIERQKEMGGSFVQEVILEAAKTLPSYQELESMHSEGVMGKDSLTPLGLAIGLSNARRLGVDLNDEIWFPN